MQILQDDNGDVMEEIKDDNNGARRIKRAIVKRWLRGKGKEPVSWRTLVEVLESVKLKELVKDICSALGYKGQSVRGVTIVVILR